tara:strand:- start:291 stop:620 length:330 start_codon:yes stop_codon:yes gene_type:complete
MFTPLSSIRLNALDCKEDETRQYTLTSSDISAIRSVEIPKGYLIITPCILSYSAIFLIGVGGGSVLLPIEDISCFRESSSSVKPIGSSSAIIGNEKKNNNNKKLPIALI